MQISKGLTSTLDASRWLAALMVLISHAHHLFLANYQNVESKNPIWKAFYFICSFGGEAVVVFFVVSGFLVGGLTADRWVRQSGNGERIAIRHYFVQRISRIYTVLLPALCFGGALDYLGWKFLDSTQIYSDPQRFEIISLNWPVVLSLSASVFFGNLAMLQTVIVQVWGSNGPLWSLACEWWYYCLFAAAMYVYFGRGAWRMVSLLCLIAMVWLLPGKLLLLMLIWLVGIFAYFYLRAGFYRPPPIVGLFVFVCGLIISRFNHPAANAGQEFHAVLIQFVKDFALALTYCFALISFSNIKESLAHAKLHERLAAFSYSSYLTHFPLLIFSAALLNQVFGLGFLRQPSYSVYAVLALMVVLLFFCGYIFSLFTERHTKKVAMKLEVLSAM